MAVDMSVYTLNSEKNKVNKTVNSSDLSLVTTYQGTLKDETDLMNPSILLELPAVPAFNYVYITQLGRYYFVRDYSIVRNGLYRINLREDVLTSFGSQILQQGAVLSRYESDENPMLVDSKRPMSSAVSYSIIPFTASGTHRLDKTLLDSSSRCFAVTLSTGPATGEAYGGTVLPFETLPLVASPIGANGITYACTKSTVKELIQYMNSNDFASFIGKLFVGHGSEGIINIVAFPFDIDIASSNSELLQMFNSPIGSLTGYRIRENGYYIINYGTYVPGVADSFLDFEPFTRYKVYLPYIGWEDIPAKDMVQSTSGIGLAYAIDLRNGEAEAMLYDPVTRKPYRIISGQVGVNVPITSSNALDQARNTLNNGLNAAMGLGSLAAGVGTGNAPVAVAGATNLVNAGIRQVENTISMRGTAPSSSLSMINHSIPFILKETQGDLIPTNYGHTIGYPSMIYKVLSTLSGYAEIDSIHLEGFTTATEAEIDEIENLLKSGVIF